MTRRSFLAALCGAGALALAGCNGQANSQANRQVNGQASGGTSVQPTLRLSGPALAETLPLLRLADLKRPQRIQPGYSFSPWRSPDQLRALVAGGQADAAVLSLTAAVTLCNKGLPVRVVALSSPPLWIVSTHTGLRDLRQLDGQELCLPFGPGEYPDLLLRALTARLGLRMTPRHTGGGLEALSLLLSGRARHALLSEPTASLALRRSQQKGGQTLFKAVDIHAAWAGAFPESPVLAHGALALLGAPDGSRKADALRSAYAREAAEVAIHPKTAAELATRLFPELGQQAVDGVVPGSGIRLSLGPKAAAGARFLLARLLEQSPQALGGHLPPESFLELGA